MNWIPVTERVPDTRRNVLVTKQAVLLPSRQFVVISSCNMGRDGPKWQAEGHYIFPYRVTAWAELPEHYSE